MIYLKLINLIKKTKKNFYIFMITKSIKHHKLLKIKKIYKKIDLKMFNERFIF